MCIVQIPFYSTTAVQLQGLNSAFRTYLRSKHLVIKHMDLFLCKNAGWLTTTEIDCICREFF